MPVILRTKEEIDQWLSAPAAEALKLQRPLPDNSLKIVARGLKMDSEDLRQFELTREKAKATVADNTGLLL